MSAVCLEEALLTGGARSFVTVTVTAFCYVAHYVQRETDTTSEIWTPSSLGLLHVYKR